MDVFKTAQKVDTHLGYFCDESLSPRTFKIAQSGHTGRDRLVQLYDNYH